jgi:cyanate permease
VVVLLYLPASPLKAKFLSDPERKWLADTLENERALARRKEGGGSHLLSVLTEPRVIGMALYYMMLSISVYGVSYWLPTLVKGFGVSNTTNGMLNIVPWLAATIVLAWLPAKLRAGNRTMGAMLAAALLGVMFFLGSVLLPTNTLRFAALCLGAPCMYLLLPCFWTMPPKFLTGARAAAGIAAINSIGNVGGFIAQNLVPWVRQTSGSVKAPMLIPATCLMIFAIVTLILMRRSKAALALAASSSAR